jgi:RNA polymerase sigma factor (sigma-70 family)
MARSAPKKIRFLRKIGIDPGDLVQETLLSFLSGSQWNRSECPDVLKHLMRLMHRIACDKMRSSKARSRREISHEKDRQIPGKKHEEAVDALDSVEWIMDPQNGPLRDYPEEREIVKLLLDGKTQAEIAEILGKSPGDISKRKKHAFEICRRRVTNDRFPGVAT